MKCTECGRDNAEDHTYLNIKSMCPDCYNEIYLREDYGNEWEPEYSEEE